MGINLVCKNVKSRLVRLEDINEALNFKDDEVQPFDVLKPELQMWNLTKHV